MEKIKSEITVKMNLMTWIILLNVLVGCARVQTLNMTKHQYSNRADHIIWIQLAGFSEDHLPLLRFSVADADYRTNIEQVDCVGKMWAYNLFNIRPESYQNFLAQSTGSKNIKGSCVDVETPSSWNILGKLGYDVSLIETGAVEQQSFQTSLKCSVNNVVDLTTMRYYQMGPEAGSDLKTFHYQASSEEVQKFLKPGLYLDKSCQKGVCYSSLSSNFKALWRSNVTENNKTFFVIRDFNLQNALKKKDISLARESLQEIDRIVNFIKTTKESGYLIIISGAESMPIEFPLKGKEWADFESKGKNIVFKNSTLLSPVLAKGAMAENFCGLFEESEMFNRVIYKPDRKVFDWDFLKPF